MNWLHHSTGELEHQSKETYWTGELHKKFGGSDKRFGEGGVRFEISGNGEIALHCKYSNTNGR